jgi:N-acetyl-beta-hexosaminidase
MDRITNRQGDSSSSRPKPIYNRQFLFFFLLLFSPLLTGYAYSIDPVSELSQAGINLIPYPQEVNLTGTDFILGNGLTIVVDKDASENDLFAARLLAEELQKDWDVTAGTAQNPSGKSIILTRHGRDDQLEKQGYSLVASSEGITLQANDEAGLFYGVQTILQLVQDAHNPIVKGIEIKDWPDIESRAVHYDTKHH